MIINIWTNEHRRPYAADFETMEEAWDDINDPAPGHKYLGSIDVDAVPLLDLSAEAAAWRGEQERDASEEVAHRRELWREHVGIV